MTTRCRCRRRRQNVISGQKFFKVITDPLAHYLRIPPEFMKLHGRNLGNRVFLKVPRTTVSWEVELIHTTNGETLLQKGWKEFALRYSLSFGHFLMFKYNGHSQFNVLIFDRTACVINYPDSEAEPSRTKSDDSIVVLEHLPSAKPKLKIVQDSAPQRRKRAPKKQIPLALVKETSRAYQKALHFAARPTFRNPFFISLMYPCYIKSAGSGLGIPLSFVRENLPSELSSTNATLGIKKKVWPIRLYCNKRARISRGWKDFVKDNRIKVGDACLFEFELGNHFHWNVIIFKS